MVAPVTDEQIVFTAYHLGWRAAAQGEVLPSYNVLLRWAAAFGPVAQERRHLILDAYERGVSEYAAEMGVQLS